MRLPALTVAICYVCGLLAGHYTQLTPSLLGATVAAGLPVIYGGRRWGHVPDWFLSLFLCLLLVGSGALWYTIHTRVMPQNHVGRFCDREDPVSLTGVIVRDPDVRGRYTLLTVEIDSISVFRSEAGLNSATGRVVVRVGQALVPGTYGDRVRVIGRLRSPTPARNPGGFDAWMYYTGQDIYGFISVREPAGFTILASLTEPTFYMVVVRPLKKHIERTIDRTLDGAPSALVKGILLGQRRQLPEDLLSTFTAIGLSHILAVSGLHVGIITLIGMTLFSVLRFPRPAAVCATLVTLILYAFITDLTPSVVRSSIMAGLLLIGDLLDRNTDSVNILAVAALVILIIWPEALFALSFQLSFVATLSIVTGYGRLKGLLPERMRRSHEWWARWLRDGLAVSLAAQLGTVPIIAYTFFQTAWIAPVANLFIGPLVFLTTTLGVLAVIAALFSLSVAGLFSAANWLVLETMIQISTLMALIPGSLIHIPRPPLICVFVYYLLFLILLYPPRTVAVRRVVACIGIAAAIAFGVYQIVKPKELTITMIDVGQGDAIYVVYPDGYTMLIDGGPYSPTFDSGTRIIVPFLRANGKPRIDTIIVTHPHTDHYGGFPAVLDEVEVGEIITGDGTPDSPYYRFWQRTIEKHQVPVRSVSAGDSLWGNGHFRGVFLHPTPAFKGNPPPYGPNNASLVLKLIHGEFSILLTGDVEEEAEHRLVASRPDLRSTVIKAPHHGSNTSSITELVEMVQPRAVLISVGLRNHFNHPSPVVLERYKAAGADVYRTDERGAIILRSDGADCRIETMVGAFPQSTWLTPSEALGGINLTGFWGISIFSFGCFGK